jgi:hypothetical protein
VRDALRQTLRQFGLLFVTFTDIIQARACCTCMCAHTQAHMHEKRCARITHARAHRETCARAHARTHAPPAVALQAFNNDKWMAGWVRDDLQGSHYVCSWKVPNREPDMATGSFRRTAYYMIAARKEGQSPVKCLEELGCNAKTKHKKLPLSC